MKALSLARAITFYLESRRQLGFALKCEGALLRNLAGYAQQVRHRGPLTTDLALRWVQRSPLASSPCRARRLEVVRGFALFWRAFDPRTQIPPAGLFGPTYRRRPVHLYTPEEIAVLLAAAQQLPPPQSLRPSTLVTLLGLLACTGLRISEALHLQLQDWDPTEALLRIRRAKSGQSRYVPVSLSTAAALQTYLQARRKAFPRARSSAFFLNEHGQPLTYRPIQRTFRAICDQLGWQQQPRPRLHDLRHYFAVGRLIGWYRQGHKQVHRHILALAVYLGHRNIRHTYWYLSAVPELLALGTARWAQALAGQKGALHG